MGLNHQLLGPFLRFRKHHQWTKPPRLIPRGSPGCTSPPWIWVRIPKDSPLQTRLDLLKKAEVLKNFPRSRGCDMKEKWNQVLEPESSHGTWKWSLRNLLSRGSISTSMIAFKSAHLHCFSDIVWYCLSVCLNGFRIFCRDHTSSNLLSLFYLSYLVVGFRMLTCLLSFLYCYCLLHNIRKEEASNSQSKCFDTYLDRVRVRYILMQYVNRII